MATTVLEGFVECGQIDYNIHIWSNFFIVDCDADICNQLGAGLGSNTFASFLPGICIALCTVATGGLHVGQVNSYICT